jgi:short-subunit dehydrogenase
METILIIGATSGLGEGFTRRFHALGKKLIITGRRQDRLAALQKELPGLEVRPVCQKQTLLPS